MSNFARISLVSFLLFATKASAQDYTDKNIKDEHAQEISLPTRVDKIDTQEKFEVRIVEINTQFYQNIGKFFECLDNPKARLALEKDLDYSYFEKGGSILFNGEKFCVNYCPNILAPVMPLQYLFLSYYEEIEKKQYFAMFHHHPLLPREASEPSEQDYAVSFGMGPGIVFAPGYSCFRVFALQNGKIIAEKEYPRLYKKNLK